ncbi:MAG: PEP/pyruvate-binding domain-containing protein, partial [Pirellulales bacterium]
MHYFSDPLDGDAAQWKATLGSKGASLKQMSHAGLRVPPGFTISTACCGEYFVQQHQWPAGLEEQLRANLARLERETGQTLGRGARPLLVSVRSGAAASMPGMMDTLLNCGLHPGLADDVGDTPHFWRLYLQFVQSFAKTVAGLDADKFVVPPLGDISSHEVEPQADRLKAELRTGRETTLANLEMYERLSGRPFPTEPWPALVQCIDAVFESWNSQRAALYRQRHDIRGLQGTAVNVQMMFPSEVSGVLFTEDPSQPAAGQMVIEASYGLGESVVSGEVTPDRFVLRRHDGSLVSQQIGHKAAVVVALGPDFVRDPDAASLGPPQLEELYRLALQVERHFGHAVDVEWGWADGRFALLQARPIRHLDSVREVER